MSQTERTGPRQEAGPTIDTTVMVTRQRWSWRTRRIRHLARRELDQMETPSDRWCFFGEPLDWHAIHMDRGVPERRAIGADMAEAGWLP